LLVADIDDRLEGVVPMVIIALCSTLIGAVLGTSFRVQVLFPAAVLSLLIVSAVAALERAAISSAMLAAVVFVVSLQIGYLGGLMTRFFMAASRLSSGPLLRSRVRS
jgi:hypothetical protein